MYPQFTLFHLVEINPPTFKQFFKPPEKQIYDYGYNLQQNFTLEIDILAYQILLQYPTRPPVSILQIFEDQQPFLQFYPLAAPSPTSFQTGKFSSNIFDNLIGISEQSYVMKFGTALHEGVQKGLLYQEVRNSILKGYYSGSYFKNCNEQDLMTDEVLSDAVDECQKMINQIQAYNAVIINEKHINNQFLGLQGKIDIFGENIQENLKIVIELKTRSVSSYHKESHYKQVSMYALHELMENQSENIYFDAIGILQDSGSRIFRNGIKQCKSSLFYDKKAKEHMFLAHCIGLLIEQRQIYLLLIHLLLHYVIDEKNQQDIKIIINNYFKSQTSSSLFESHEIYLKKLNGKQIIFKEIRHNFIQDLKLILNYDFHQVVDLQTHSIEFLEIQENFGVEKFVYKCEIKNGCYRLFEVKNGRSQRCGIFCKITTGILQCSTQLDCTLKYIFNPIMGQNLQSLILFDFKIKRYYFLSLPKQYVMITNNNYVLTIPEEIDLDKSVSEIKRILSKKENQRKITFQTWKSAQSEYENYHLVIDSNLNENEFLYAVMSRYEVFLHGDDITCKVNYCKQYIQFFSKVYQQNEEIDQDLVISISD